MPKAAVALGSNLGDRLDHLRAGLDGLGGLGTVVAVSKVHETDPVGGPEQGRYLNAAVLIDTDLAPLDLLAGLLEIERGRGRERKERWGPRTLDLDLIAYEGQTIDLPTLEIPHPRAHDRGFVLAPLVEVWPDATLADGSTAREALAGVGLSGIRTWQGSWPEETPNMGAEATRWVLAQLVLFALWLAVVLFTTVPLTAVRAIIGAFVLAAGVAAMEASRRALGTNLTAFPQPREGTTLVDHGIYRFVRHPIYTGVVTSLVGASVLAGSIGGGVVALLLLVFFNAKASVEERALAIAVPGYGAYLATVRRRFLFW
jgi:2-amino-4-hydroxy-6-hydroxymethyldihydropteridine diphosphokinase